MVQGNNITSHQNEVIAAVGSAGDGSASLADQWIHVHANGAAVSNDPDQAWTETRTSTVTVIKETYTDEYQPNVNPKINEQFF